MNTRHTYLSLLRTFDDPALSAVCSPIEPAEDLSFLRDMRRVCRATPDGVGLAAPQVGVLRRAVFLWPGRAGFGAFLINPRILEASGDVEEQQERCLSYPGVAAWVKRYTVVRVAWLGENLNPREETFKGFDARLVMHEIDHLSGVCLVGDAWREQRRSDGINTMIASFVRAHSGTKGATA